MSTQSETVYSLPGGGALLAPELANQLDLEPEALQRWFEATSYGDQASKVGQGGRQAAWFVNGPFGQAVLRHYRRGGLVARFNESSYLWQGASRTRSWREFQVMSYLHNKGLAVPQSAGGRMVATGFLVPCGPDKPACARCAAFDSVPGPCLPRSGGTRDCPHAPIRGLARRP